MGTNEQLKQAIKDSIRTNHIGEITGQVLQDVLLSVVTSVTDGATFAGVATPGTDPGMPDKNVFYLATEAGVYTNFGGYEVSNEAVIFENKSGNWVASKPGIPTAKYSVDNRRALNGDQMFAVALHYPYVAIYVEDKGDNWKYFNSQVDLINAVVMNKYNGNCRFFIDGVRVDVQNRVLNNANKIVSQVAVGPLQLVGGKLAMANTADKTFRRIYSGSWSPWEEVAATGKTGSATGAEVFNSYSGDAANIATGIYSHAEGFKTKAQGISSHAEGDSNTAFGAMSHAEGIANFVSSRGGHVEGGDNRINSADGATGRESSYAHAEGYNNEIGPYSPQAHIEGSTNFAGSRNAHVEGYNNRLENGSRNAHIEGENNMTQPDARVSHTEGGDNRNNGAAYAHVEGKSNVANNGATGGHVEGLNNTINNEAEHAAGHWNLSTPGKTHYSVGIGSSNDRKNAYEIDKQGNLYILGVNGYDGKNAGPAKSVQKLLENGAGSGAPSEGQPGFRVVDLTRYISAQEDIDIGSDGQFINPSKDLQSIVLQGYYKGDSLGARFESFPLSARCDDSAGHRLFFEFDTYGSHYKLVFETSADYDYISKFLHAESQSTPKSKA